MSRQAVNKVIIDRHIQSPWNDLNEGKASQEVTQQV